MIRDVIDEARIENIVAEGTISIFNEIINGTTGDDNLVGSPGDNVNTQFFVTQGSTFGGTDTIDGGGGTDEVFVQNISDFLSIGTFGTGAGPHVIEGSNSTGSISGKLTMVNVEQFFFSEAGGVLKDCL